MKMIIENELVPSMRDTIFGSSGSDFKDALFELTEVGLDQVFKDSLVKDIPVINTLAAICKTGYNIHERNLIKQTAAFISAFNDGNINEDTLIKHKKELEDDPKKAEREVGRILLLLSKNIDLRKSKVLGSFYKYYIKGELKWAEFCELSEVNSRMFLSDYDFLEEMMCEPKYEKNGYPSEKMYKISRLVALGLAVEENIVRDDGDGNIVFLGANEKYVISPIGKTFARMMEQ